MMYSDNTVCYKNVTKKSVANVQLIPSQKKCSCQKLDTTFSSFYPKTLYRLLNP